MAAKFQTLLPNLNALGLDHMNAYLSAYISEINQQSMTFTEAMLKLTNLELQGRHKRQQQRVIDRAHFPKAKTMKSFDFDFQPSINRQEILGFEDLTFIKNQENLVFIGSPEVGKTHLAISIGLAACQQGQRTLFINCHELLARLRTAYEKGTLD